MPRRSLSRGRLALAATGVLSLSAAALAGGVTTVAPVLAGGGASPLANLLAPTAHLNTRSVAAAVMVEKLHSGGEGGRGAAQELYENHAYPATDIAPAQTTKARKNFAAKTRGGTSFTQVGPDGQTVPADVTYTGVASNVSGRTTALLPVGTCTPTACTLLIGTGGGGVWRTTNAMAANPTWTPVGAGITSNAIGSLTAAGSAIYAGTGEPNGSSDNEAGTGLFKSTDGGSTFSRVPTALSSGVDIAVGRSVASVVVDRTNPAHLLIGTAVARHGSSSVNGGRWTPPSSAPVGLYESVNSGASWTLAHAEASDTVQPATTNGRDYFRGGVTRVEQDPLNAGTYYAAFSDYGLYRGSGTSWTRIYTSGGAGDPALTLDARTEFDAVALPTGKTRIYLGDATALPDPADPTSRVSALFRTDDATTATPLFAQLSSSDPANPGGFASYNYCGGQCSYDMPVASPDDQPNTVLIGGQMQYGEIFTAHQPSNGRAIQRSEDGGATFADMSNDAATGNGLHPDQHAIAFAGGAVFLGSDGGVNRLRAPFVDRSTDCDTRGLTAVQLVDCHAWLTGVPTENTAINAGLETLQFQSVSVSPAGDALLGGTQDNGTWSMNASGGQSQESVGGDGGQSGFDPVTPTTRYHSYYGPTHDVNFTGSSTTGWDYMSQPLDESGEAASFYTPLSADPVVGGTVFDGLEHVWRTTDSGGDPAYLQQHCNELTGDFARGTKCGDWVALGGPSLVEAKSVTSGGYGYDKSGSYVVAITRATTDRGTMWAGTRRGRLFLTRNADAANAQKVSFTRLDDGSTPTRFISGISVDPTNSNHALVTYSGYDAYATQANTATGHVFDVRVDAAGKATFTDVTGDLGDQPVTAVAFDAVTGKTYLGTDFGVLSGVAGSASHWVAVPGLPVVSVYGLTMDASHRTLYAASHGRGVWGAGL